MKKLTPTRRYKAYIASRPEPRDKLSNQYNLLDDLNSTDKEMMKAVKAFLLKRKLKL
jgi:hypothetical protein